MVEIANVQTKVFKKIKYVLIGYAQIYFSQKWQVGLLFLLATFIIPNQGFAGLFVFLLSNLIAKILGLSEEYIKEGFFGYNGLLTGLALGLSYRMNFNFIVMLIIASFLGVLIASVIRSITEKYLHTPVLSFPFVFTSWILIASGEKFKGLIYTTKPFEIDFMIGLLPNNIEFFLRSAAAALFQLNVPAGILIVIGILIFSRHAFLLAIFGLFLGSTVYKFLGGTPSDLQGNWIGFNFILTSIAIGGVFVVPGIDSFLLAGVAAILTAIITAGSMIILEPLGVPMLAFPFLITVTIILYTLKTRISPSRLKSITIPKESPEENLKFAKNSKMSILTDISPMFELPVNGEWSITQGFDGDYTHQNLWAYALDFEVKDEANKTYDNLGVQCSDYYAWNMPVFAPMDGKIIKIINHIDDNSVGHINSENNWGNTIIIWHYESVYTSLSHLAKGSIKVKVGDFVRRKQIIGKVGNSGRSPYPHLHFQVQYSPEIGAVTAYSKLLNYVVKKDNEWIYHSTGIPKKDDIIKNIDIDTSIFDAASFPVNVEWEYDIFKDKKTWIESWQSSIDFYGNRFLKCKNKNAKLQYFSNNKFLFLLNYEGVKGTSLEWLYLGVPRLPFTKFDVKWSEELNANHLLPLYSKLIFEIAEPFYPLAKLVSKSRFKHMNKDKFTITTKLSLKGILASKLISDIEIDTYFEQHLGVVSIKVKRDNKIIFEAYLRGKKNEEVNRNIANNN